jgi:hypothetical protein
VTIRILHTRPELDLKENEPKEAFRNLVPQPTLLFQCRVFRRAQTAEYYKISVIINTASAYGSHE